MKLCQIGCGEHARVAHGPSQATLRARARRPRARRLLRPRRARGPSRSAASFGFAPRVHRPGGDARRGAAGRRGRGRARGADRRASARSSSSAALPLLLEKPPGETVAEVDRLIAAAERGGRTVPHQVAFNRRFAPLVRELRAADRGGRRAAAPPLRDDARRAARPRLLDDRHPRPRRRPLPRRVATTPRPASATASCRSSAGEWPTSSWMR